VDDKIIGVVNDDKKNEHIKTIDDLGEYFKTETKYFWEKYKELKKPGTGETKGFFDKDEAIKVIKECEKRYFDVYAKNLE
jgi:inorganic pyrophosphatase